MTSYSCRCSSVRCLETVIWNIEIIRKNVIANIRRGYQRMCGMMTENVDSRWSPRSCTRNFLRCFWNEIPLFFPPHIIAHPARKRYARIADDKIPTNNDHSFVGAFHMYTNDIASFWISSAVPRLLMYLFDHIWIIGLPIGPLLNKWVTCLVWLMSVMERKKEREIRDQKKERKLLFVTLKMKIDPIVWRLRMKIAKWYILQRLRNIYVLFSSLLLRLETLFIIKNIIVIIPINMIL